MFGVLVEPRLGRVVEGDTSTAQIAFAGLHQRADYAIHIQVLDHPEDLTSWVTFATAVTDREPSSTDATMYEWHVTAAPAALSPSRWTQGGLLHVRAIGDDGEPLWTVFHDADACLAEPGAWLDRAARCGAELPGGAVVVSAADVAHAANRPLFLDRLGVVDSTETSAYYAAIAAPPTLSELETTYGLGPSSAALVYYNAADLGIGRAMQCQDQVGGGLACAVSNYGQFGGDAGSALDQTITGVEGAGGAFATVAMVYQPPIEAPNSVRFLVYGATGALATAARLDTVGDNTSIPNNCINCHDSSARYDAAVHAVIGGRFLPFDPAAFEFSSRASYRAGDQLLALARLNGLIHDASPTPSIREVIEGEFPAGSADQAPRDFVPAGWRETTLDQEVYRNVIAAGCRTCHASRTDDLSFQTAAQFRAVATKTIDHVCTQHDMPNAEVPLSRLWAGSARAYLAASLGIAACDP